MSATQQEKFGQEVSWDATQDELPAYAPMLAAYQRAHASELRAMIEDLPLRLGDKVLDMACGAGVYTHWLAEKVGADGNVVGVDLARGYLTQAHAATLSRSKSQTGFSAGDIAALPFADNTFDLVWCAQSLWSLPAPLDTLRELRRVTRPDGTVAIFENDAIHQLIFPWPAELELAVRQAQLQALAESSPDVAKFFIGRDLCGAFAEAGLNKCRIASYSSVRHAPLEPDEQQYIAWYLQDMRARAEPYLEPAMRDCLARLVDPGSSKYLPAQPAFYVTYIDIVACGVK